MTAMRSLCAVGALLGAAGLASATTWNAATDFSTVSNPAPPWNWINAATPPPAITGSNLYSTPLNLTPDTKGWFNGGADRVYKNTGAVPEFIGSGVAIAPGQLILEGSNLYAVAQWFAPTNGTYGINVTFTGAGAAAGTFADVLVGQYSTVYAAGTINGYGNAGPTGFGSDFGIATFSWSGNVTLAGGQAVVFMAKMSGARGVGPASAVVLDATITTVPAPAGGALLAAAGMLAARRRRR